MKNAGILRQQTIPTDPEEFKKWFTNRKNVDVGVIGKILKDAVCETTKKK